jgi:AraC family transcriptional regulator
MNLPIFDVEPSSDTRPTLRSAAVYEGVLGRFGGRRVEATSIVRSRELYVALYQSPPYDLRIAPIEIPRLSINLVDAPVFGGLASGRSGSYGGRRYSLFFTPSNADAQWAKQQPSQHLNIYFHDGLLDELADGPGALLRRDRPLLDAHARRIKPWIDALELSIVQSGPSADDASLGLAHLIVAELARTPTRRAPALRPMALARVRDYVCANLGEMIRVSDLAALTGMSEGRFALCFRASTGCTPHRFILRQRIEAAMRMLRDSAVPMAEVAIACGFSSQQHMTTTMRQRMGITPLKVRVQRSESPP